MQIYSDGASRGNPGKAAIGFIILDGTKLLKQQKATIGTTTNNVAEYTALIEALKQASRLTKDSIEVFSDSQLMIRQLKGEYKVKKPHLRKLYEEAKSLESNFESISYNNVRRTDKNIKLVDALANEALDA